MGSNTPRRERRKNCRNNSHRSKGCPSRQKGVQRTRQRTRNAKLSFTRKAAASSSSSSIAGRSSSKLSDSKQISSKRGRSSRSNSNKIIRHRQHGRRSSKISMKMSSGLNSRSKRSTGGSSRYAQYRIKHGRHSSHNSRSSRSKASRAGARHLMQQLPRLILQA